MTVLNRTDKRRRDVSGPCAGLQVRAEGDAVKELSGYGAVFYRATDPGSEYWLWSDLVERLMPGCFDRALKEDNVCAFFNHEPDTILARRSFDPEDTLVLSVDEIGLRYAIPYDAADADHVRVFGKVRTKKVRGSSFMFIPTKETYRSETDPETKSRLDIIEVTEVRLFEVGPVVFPAYDSATSEVRRRMSGELTDVEREARERRNAASGADRLRQLRHRVDVDTKLRSLSGSAAKR